jgi:hypothetical protein
MTKLEPNEVELTGNWVFENGRMRGDAACERIKWLVSHHLKKLAISKDYGAWETLYQDPEDGRYWEQTYPHGEMHGGGPPKLTMLSLQQAKTKYQFS